MAAGDIHRILRETGLPLVPRLAEICGALEERGVAVVRSDPGSGKSTLLPLALLDRPPGGFRPLGRDGGGRGNIRTEVVAT